ncbi:MAG: putative Transposon Ty3-I Gag-Pol polyprotein [Streblomastix strix]|uniref:Putative Transposon Ty3-I Gag-Pol polyprotein n=1 Tax=Streblomastix strix TaxID=222440 RepID=A0A5J4V8B4_9EUKA|nr:MAG: putative Transposon Ty3-I Gag-Pol polyprotein [Streblomastix strix]
MRNHCLQVCKILHLMTSIFYLILINAFDPVGRRLLQFLPAWNKLGVKNLIMKGIEADWISKDSINLLRINKRIRTYNCNHDQSEMMESEIKKELKEGIIKKVQDREVSFYNPCFLIKKKDSNKIRKIIDCTELNCQLKDEHFQMEDLQTVKQLLLPNDFATVVDIHSAFSHIPVAQDLIPFLSFNFQDQAYSYVAMPFGIKSAPRTFCKILRPAIQFIRDQLKLRCVAYCDDLLFLDQNQSKLRIKSLMALKLLQNLGWIISMDKCNLEPQQEFSYLGWKFNSKQMTIQCTEERVKKILIKLQLWEESIQKKQNVRVKDLAGIIGKLSFCRTQIKQASLHLRILNKIKSNAANQNGWNSRTIIHKGALREINWWKLKITQNSPTTLVTRDPEAILTTDASQWGWGGVFQIREQAEIIVHEHNLLKNKVTAIRVQTDNSSTSYNLRRQAAAAPLATMTARILTWAEDHNIQLQPVHIPGILNRTADALSRLSRSGDYFILPSRAQRIMKSLGVQPTLDVFATRKSKILKRYCSPKIDSKALARDGLQVSWKNETPWLHPPIPLIGQCLQKILQQQVQQAIIITPDWKAQFWRPLLDKLTVNRVEVGLSKETLHPGKHMKKKGYLLPPGRIVASLISANQIQMEGVKSSFTTL